MADELEIVNAEITSARIGFQRGFALSADLTLNYGGTGQGFGGYVIGGNPFDSARCARHGEQKNLAAEMIGGILGVVEVEHWGALVGKIVRVKRTEWGGSIVAIGHPFKDRWFSPDEAFNRLKGPNQ